MTMIAPAHSAPLRHARANTGFTLLELMLVVAIVAILAALAYPSYSGYVIKTKRVAGKTALLELAARQERHFFDNKTYTTDLTALGYATSPAAVNDDGAILAAADSSERVYLLRVKAATANCAIDTCFALEAAPQLGQANDAECGTLTLSSTNERSAGGTLGARCW